MLNIYLILTKNILRKNLLETDSYIKRLESENIGLANRPVLSPDILNLERKYHEVRIENIEDFFDDSKSDKKSTEYLSSKGVIKMENIIDMSCTEEYTSGYRGYDDIQLYLNIPVITDYYKGFDEVIRNANDYKLKDDFLVSFIGEKNEELQKNNPQSRVIDISKCDIQNDGGIISYTISTNSERSLYIDYFEDNYNSKKELGIEKTVALMGCSKKPFVFTSDKIAFYYCGYGDAGIRSLSIYKVNFATGTSEEIFNCISDMALAENAPPPEIHCWEPYTYK